MGVNLGEGGGYEDSIFTESSSLNGSVDRQVKISPIGHKNSPDPHTFNLISEYPNFMYFTTGPSTYLHSRGNFSLITLPTILELATYPQEIYPIL